MKDAITDKQKAAELSAAEQDRLAAAFASLPSESLAEEENLIAEQASNRACIAALAEKEGK